ncbi:extracellular catalytic domain type 1 short-chain-length polyhydroxyalkanoate depolymerase [Colwellia sp. MEBiC06753]
MRHNKVNYWFKISALLTLLLSFSSLASFKALDKFGQNPGELTASYFLPSSSSTSLPLVVLLHGCTQNGETLAVDSGLIGLAKQHEFAVLVPQQSSNNNITSCFNWFSQQDNQRDSGETLSIKNMVSHFQQQINTNSVYIVGLSAGGAMSASLLIHYPNLFDAGAVVAGIPYPCADNLITAISCMRNGPSPENKLAEKVKTMYPDVAKWPRLSIWTGAKDNIVHPENALVLAKQWQSLNQLSMQPSVSQAQGYRQSLWEADQKTFLQLVTIDNLTHGIAVNPAQLNGGTPSDYLLESPIAAMPAIIDFFLSKNSKP